MTQRRTTTQRGLGYRHQQQRKALLARFVEGSACWWCGGPMYSTQALEADHSHARSQGGHNADRLLHEACNRSRGDGSRDHTRPALTRHTGGCAGNSLPWG